MQQAPIKAQQFYPATQTTLYLDTGPNDQYLFVAIQDSVGPTDGIHPCQAWLVAEDIVNHVFDAQNGNHQEALLALYQSVGGS